MTEDHGSISDGVCALAERWARSSRALKGRDQRYGGELADLVKETFTGDLFSGYDDPLEAAVFLALVGMMRREATLYERESTGEAESGWSSSFFPVR